VLKSLVYFTVLTLYSCLAWPASVSLTVTNLRSDEGYIRYILFASAAGFPDQADQGIRQGAVAAAQFKQESYHIELADLAPGAYALALIHDENANHKLDTNFLGIPKEGFGFSNNPRILFGPPSFEKASFELKEDQVVTIEMRYL
jgi:uncharacterized protein (DUF2141 family)